jgi:formate hydrogenlyase transcriptional activator
VEFRVETLQVNGKVKTRKTKQPQKRGRVRPGAAEHRVPAKELEEIVLAIRRGKIDALVVAGTTGDQVLTLQGAEHPYRVLVETINDGVATLDPAGIVLYANSRFAAILRAPVENFVGTSLQSHVSPSGREILQNLIAEGLSNTTQAEIT